MNGERFRQIEELYHAVREAAAEKRAALLDRADPEVRQQVESLLQQATGDFPNRPDAFDLTGDSTVAVLAPETLLGPYRIESKLGEGGMGEVFRAIDTRLGRAVAIKTIREQFNARFEREARAISSLNHPNICTLYDVGPNYLVMELVEGETLAARLKHGPLPVETALLYGSQIAAALAESHGKGIVHRDLKPGNIMIGKTGAKVLDFGLARSADDETVTGSRMVVGTPAYMAPEQREGRPVDGRADIYAFGCVLYEMLTGERASLGRKRIQPRKLETIVSRCLEQDAALRWQTAPELERQLTAISKASPGSRTVDAAPSTPSPTPRAAPRVSWRGPTRQNQIMLGEFENKTDDPAFDGILRQGLAVQLEQSPLLTLVSDQQIQQTLRYMERPPGTRLAPEVAQEIAERAGGAAVLDGSIASLGSKYILWLRARNCRTGDIWGQEQVQAGKKEDVLKALTKIAVQIRARLSESLATPGEHSTPLEQVTTPSLEALKAYTAALNTVLTRGFAAAIPHLRRALAIDPEFAMAEALLGFFYVNTGQGDLGVPHTLKAYERRERVSDQERFFILFLYDRQVTGNLHKELATIEAWVQTYPQDWNAWGVLGGWGTRGTGQYERGLEAVREGLRLDPSIPFPYDSLAVHHTSLGQFTEAADALRQAAERKLEIPNFLCHRYYLAFLTGDKAGMKREIDRARGGRETEDWMSHNQALVLAHDGQMRNARMMWHHAVVLAQQNGDAGKAGIYQAAAAVCEAHCGNWEAAQERAHSALELAKARDVTYAAAFALALSGDHAGAQSLAAELAARFPEDTPVQFEYLPTLRALSALSQKASQDAIEHLRTALPYDLAMPGTAFFAKFGGMYTAHVRGRAYLEAGQGEAAAGEFQKILDHPGIVLADPIGALAHLQLGRALVVSGDNDRARNAYEKFLALWKDADAELPILQQARAEYASL